MTAMPPEWTPVVLVDVSSVISGGVYHNPNTGKIGTEYDRIRVTPPYFAVSNCIFKDAFIGSVELGQIEPRISIYSSLHAGNQTSGNIFPLIPDTIVQLS
jgi:hypothetical protein